MTGRRAPACLFAAFALLALSTPPQRAATPVILVLDLPSGRTVSAVQPDLAITPVRSASIAHVVTLLAALEAGAVSGDQRVVCQGRQVSPAEALANSCNDFFTSVAERLPRGAFNSMATALGLTSVSGTASVPLATVGVGGVAATPEQFLRALVRAADATAGARMRRETRDVLLEGLRAAARQGSARAIADRGIDALALAGTAHSSLGEAGFALAIFPSVHPSRAVAVLVPGGTPADASSLAAQALAELVEGTYWENLALNPRIPPAPPPGVPAAVPSTARGAPTAPLVSGMTIRVGHLRSDGYQVTQVPLEEYVARVLAGEAAARSAPAALEALAIAVRTFAIVNLDRHKGDGFALCDTTHCQVMASATAATRQAAAATAGQILTYHGQPAAIFYTASCGGRSELPSEVWPRAQDQPFLTRHEDPECRRLSEWDAEIASTALLQALNRSGMEGDEIRNVRVARRTASGRAASLRVEGLEPGEITGDELRSAVGRTLGWQLIKSTAFDVKRTSSGYRFTGRGSGHGVGMCVIGSTRMAAEGKSAAKILAEYFPGTAISTLSRAATR